ncbi:MAG: hypothetical protein JSS32_05210 [Verrucomicrobia bacterium]|nr:hypothetical protein [Verrucomicrobiota bacterium]
MNNLSPLDSVRQNLGSNNVQTKMNGVSAAASMLLKTDQGARDIVALNLPKQLAVIGASIGAGGLLNEHKGTLSDLAGQVNAAFGAVVEQNAAYQTRIQEYETHAKQTQEQLSTQQTLISELNSQLTASQSTLQSLTQEKSELTSQIDMLASKVEAQQAEASELKKQNDRIPGLESTLADKTATLAQLDEQLGSLNQELSSIKAQAAISNEDSTKALQAQQQELSQLQAKTKEQISSLTAEINTLRDQLSDKESIQERLSGKESEISSLKSQLRTLESNADKQTTRIAEMQETIETLQVDLEEANSAFASQVAMRVAEETADFEDQGQEVQSKNMTIEKLRARLIDLQGQVFSKARELAELKASHAAAFSDAELQNGSLQQQVDTLDASLANAETEIDSLKAQIEQAPKEEREKILKLESELSVLKEELAHYNSKILIIDNLGKENRELLAQVKELDESNAEFDKVNKKNAVVFERVKAKRDEYHKKLGEANGTIEQLEEQIERMKAKSSTSALGMAGKVVQGGLAATAVAMMASEPVNQAVTSTIRGLAGRLTSYDTYRQLGVQAGQAWTTHGAPMMQRAGQALSDYGTPVLKGAGQMWSDYGTPVVQGAGQMWSDYGTPVVQGASAAVMNAVNNPDDAEHGALGFTPKQILVSSVLLVGSVATTVFFWRRSAKKATPAAQD